MYVSSLDSDKLSIIKG